MAVVSGPAATALAAALAGPSSDHGGLQRAGGVGLRQQAEVSGTCGTWPFASVASGGSVLPAGNCETLASFHGPVAADCSKSIRAGPSTGTCAPPMEVTAPAAGLLPLTDRVASATKKRG